MRKVLTYLSRNFFLLSLLYYNVLKITAKWTIKWTNCTFYPFPIKILSCTLALLEPLRVLGRSQCTVFLDMSAKLNIAIQNYLDKLIIKRDLCGFETLCSRENPKNERQIIQMSALCV